MASYSKSELLYFRDIGFGYPDEVKKWDQPIRVHIASPYTKLDQAEVERLLATLRTIKGLPDLSFTNQPGNITVHFPASFDDYNVQAQESSETAPVGYAKPVFSFAGHVKDVQIFISPTAVGQQKTRTLLHELCHALGLWGHSKRMLTGEHLLGITKYSSIAAYEVASEQSVLLLDADRKALQLLYEPNIPNGLSRSAFDDYLAKRPKN